ncbi:MAG: hypothetical protein R3338_04230, partial [Thermoanaerobaculia bacterium]|nr:hypothetical protein [Thermoanaerobaculia bacterium]
IVRTRPETPSSKPRLVPPPAGMSETALRLLEELPDSLGRTIRSGRELVRAKEHQTDRFDSTVEELEVLLGGGLRRGRLTQITGARSTGRFAIVLSAIAATTSRGEPVALVDAGDHLDPRNAEESGIDLERVLWVRPETMKQAVKAAEMLITTGFPLVTLDFGLRLRGRVPDAAWTRLARAARDTGAVLLVSSPWPVSRHAADTDLSFRHGRGIWKGGGRTPTLLDGLESRIHVEKQRGRKPGESTKRAVRSMESFIN